MKPHIVPKVVLKQFRVAACEEAPVVILNKKDMTYRNRGVDHNTFTAASNYYGNGKQYTLEHELANKDEASINRVIQIIRSEVKYNWRKEDLHFLLWNNTARNPQFREHPKVGKIPGCTPEEFHIAAMDSIPDEYISDYEIIPLYIRESVNHLILPDFSIKYFVLAPDVIVVRSKPDDVGKWIFNAQNHKDEFVKYINDKSMNSAKNWLVSSSEKEFENYGARKIKNSNNSLHDDLGIQGA